MGYGTFHGSDPPELGMALSQHVVSPQLLDGLVMFNDKKWLTLWGHVGSSTNQMNFVAGWQILRHVELASLGIGEFMESVFIEA